MDPKRYRDFKNPSTVIVLDCSREGKSMGWSGSVEEVTDLQKTLAPFNIHYACDFTGTWKFKK